MPSAASARLGLTGPLGTEAPDGAANIATLIAQLEAAVGMARLGEVTSAGGAGAGLSFAAINQNFRHLRLVGVVRSNDTSVAGADAFRCRFNAAATNYAGRVWRSSTAATLGADGAGIDTSIASASAAFADLGFIANEGVAGDLPATVTGFTLDVVDYTASIWKTWLYRAVRATAGGFANGPEVTEAAGAWRSTAAITDLSLFVASAGLDAVSRATLYGLR